MSDSKLHPKPSSRCGFVALLGRPNVGKSTLMNHMLGQKLSITCRKPQTTRHRIVGIHTEGTTQMVFLDTPGIHSDQPKAINRMMNRAAERSALEADVLVFIVDGLVYNDQDAAVCRQLSRLKLPVLLVINKIDNLSDKTALLAHINFLSQQAEFAEIIPVSALRNQNLDRLEACIEKYLPLSEHIYEGDQLTDRSMRFLAAELIREKVMRQLGQELPYQIAVEIEEFAVDEGVFHISAVLLVERSGQKPIVIGNKGERLKKIGQEARQDMEALFDGKVMLNLWVKVKGGWSDDIRALRSLGYDEP